MLDQVESSELTFIPPVEPYQQHPNTHLIEIFGKENLLRITKHTCRRESTCRKESSGGASVVSSQIIHIDTIGTGKAKPT